LANRVFTGIENITEYRPVANQSRGSEMASAAAGDNRNGAEIDYETTEFQGENTASIEVSHPIISLHWGALT